MKTQTNPRRRLPIALGTAALAVIALAPAPLLAQAAPQDRTPPENQTNVPDEADVTSGAGRSGGEDTASLGDEHSDRMSSVPQSSRR